MENQKENPTDNEVETVFHLGLGLGVRETEYYCLIQGGA